MVRVPIPLCKALKPFVSKNDHEVSLFLINLLTDQKYFYSSLGTVLYSQRINFNLLWAEKCWEPISMRQLQSGAHKGCECLSLPSSLLRISDRWNPAVRKRMLSDSGLGKISPHYEVADKQKDASQTHMLQ